jgi:hypothetical protein
MTTINIIHEIGMLEIYDAVMRSCSNGRLWAPPAASDDWEARAMKEMLPS